MKRTRNPKPSSCCRLVEVIADLSYKGFKAATLSGAMFMRAGSQIVCMHFEILRELLLGGSGDLVSKVISTLIGFISTYKCSYLRTLVTKSHDPLSRVDENY